MIPLHNIDDRRTELQNEPFSLLRKAQPLPYCSLVWKTRGGVKQCIVTVFLRNIVDQLADGHTSYDTRFGEGFRGPVAPFGCEITYKPIRPEDVRCLHPLGRNTLQGVFLGYKQLAGG